MKITKDTTVSLEYTLKDKNGEILDSSETMGPLEYIHGYSMIIPGLEKALEGKETGEQFEETVLPSSAYGEINNDLIVQTTKSQFPTDVELEIGMEFQSGHHIVRVIKIDGDNITIDANHPLAGETLYFSVKILSVKETSEEELQSLLQNSSGCSCGGCSCGDETAQSCGGGCSGCN